MLHTNHSQIEFETHATFPHQLPVIKDDVTEFDLFQFENDARNRLDKLGTKKAKIIEAMSALSGRASTLQMKMENRPNSVNDSLLLDFERALRKVNHLVDDLEANFFHH